MAFQVLMIIGFAITTKQPKVVAVRGFTNTARKKLRMVLAVKLLGLIWQALRQLHYNQINKRIMELQAYDTKQIKDPVVSREEYGTYVDKEKKKKKKKKQINEKSKEIDQEKIKELAKDSELHSASMLTPEEKIRYSQAEFHPLKIICSNLPFKITSEEIFQYFNTLIAASNPDLAVPPPIKDVEFDRAKTFAILTMASRRIKDFFRSHPEFNYIQGTTTFKMIKPKEFFYEKYLGQKESGKNLDEDNKLYLGGIPLTFSDEQVKKICETFGKVKFFNLVRDGGVSKGYCFLEYQDHNAVSKAIKALNGLPIADKKLKCHAANLGAKGLSLAFTPNSANLGGIQQKSAKPANHAFGSYLLSYENINNPDILLSLNADASCKISSRAVQFLNMCYPSDLFDEEIIEDLQNDVTEICTKYGPIEMVVIPRPDRHCGYAGPSVGKIFVKFLYITHAKKARLGIAGRVYNKRTVVVSFYPEQKFNAKEYLVTI